MSTEHAQFNAIESVYRKFIAFQTANIVFAMTVTTSCVLLVSYQLQVAPQDVLKEAHDMDNRMQSKVEKIHDRLNALEVFHAEKASWAQSIDAKLEEINRAVSKPLGSQQ